MNSKRCTCVFAINKHNDIDVQFLSKEFAASYIAHRDKPPRSCSNSEKIRMLNTNLKNGRQTIENFELNFDGGTIDVEVLDKTAAISQANTVLTSKNASGNTCC